MKEFTYITEDDFPLESGQKIKKLTLSYCTYGKLNTKKDNVIWVCHALTANHRLHEWWNGLLGINKVFDTSKYFIICVNNLGSPYGSSCPKSIDSNTKKRYGMSFPDYTIRDTAASMLVLTDHLNISSIKLLIGGSCGGNIALEMAYMLKRKVKNLALLCSSAREQPWTIAIHESQRIALKNDPTFSENKDNVAQVGLKVARSVALPFYRTSESMNMAQQEKDLKKTSDFKAASYIRYQGEKLVNRFDSHCYYKLLDALDTHNIGRNRGSIEKALGRIKSKTLCIGINSDVFIPVSEQQLLNTYLPNSNYKEIKSRFGHDAFLIEIDQIQKIIQPLL